MRIIRPSTLGFQALIAIILGGAGAIIGVQVTPWGLWFGLVPPLVVAAVALRRPVRRWYVARQPFPRAWRRWLEEHVVLYCNLDAEGRTHFERDVQFILDEWRFEGVDGVEVTPERRLGVAAGAAMLLHGRPDWELPSRHTVLFYPGTFDEDYLESDEAHFDGMAHSQGPIILSAQAFDESWRKTHRGSNVVLHELAHLLDYEDAVADGIPSLMASRSSNAWKELMRREMQRIGQGASILRPYAASKPAEFFAVTVEVFFERPEAMHERHPELFEAMVAFFNLDPRTGESQRASSVPVTP